MKLFLLLTLFPLACVSCEKYPLSNLRDDHTMEELKRFVAEGEITMGMFNHAIAHDDVELLELFFTQPRGNKTEIVYEDLALTQANRQGATPISFRPLHLAAQYGSLNTTLFCLNHQANANSRTYCQIEESHHNTPCHIAALYKKPQVLIALLTAGAADMTLKNAQGKTVEDIAQEKGDAEILSIIKNIRESREQAAQERALKKPA